MLVCQDLTTKERFGRLGPGRRYREGPPNPFTALRSFWREVVLAPVQLRHDALLRTVLEKCGVRVRPYAMYSVPGRGQLQRRQQHEHEQQQGDPEAVPFTAVAVTVSESKGGRSDDAAVAAALAAASEVTMADREHDAEPPAREDDRLLQTV